MKGGNDMKKTYTMYSAEEKFDILDSESKIVFSISRKTLSLDGKKLYDSLFKEFNKGDDIVLNKDASILKDDKIANAVYDNVTEIINKVKDGINGIE